METALTPFLLGVLSGFSIGLSLGIYALRRVNRDLRNLLETLNAPDP